jgi:hypothetical protein
MIKIIEALKSMSDSDFQNLQIAVFFVEKDKDGKFPDDKKYYNRNFDFSTQKNFFVVELYSNTKVDNGVYVSDPYKNFLFTHTFLLDLTQLEIDMKDLLATKNDPKSPREFVSGERVKDYLMDGYLENLHLLADYNGDKDNYQALAAAIYKYYGRTIGKKFGL